MRRALLVAALALPLAASATTANSGQVIDPENFDATAVKSYVNAAACAGDLPLEWNILTVTGTVFSQNGTYLIFASDTAPTQDTATGGTFCEEKSTTTPAVNAGQVGSATATSTLQDGTVKGADVVKAVAFSTDGTCSSTLEGKTLYICTHWTDSLGNQRKGYATGTFLMQVLSPQPPTDVSATAGSQKLLVSWTASAATSGFVAADHYVAQATPHGQTTPVFYSANATGTSATITGLTNGVEYDVAVVAYSVGGNPSQPAKAPATATPVPSADFWDVYKDRGGQETGGCSSGAAGGLAILGAASLLALFRRKP